MSNQYTVESQVRIAEIMGANLCNRKYKNDIEMASCKDQLIYKKLLLQRKVINQQFKILSEILGGKSSKDNLKQDNHINYADYLKSAAWKSKAEEAKIRSGNRCQLCNRTGKLHAHHRTYERLGNERPEDLTVLCEDCHAKFHDIEREIDYGF